MGGVPTLGLLLIREGVITREQLNSGLREQRRRGDKLGRVLIDQGALSWEALLPVLSGQLGIPVLPPDFLQALAPKVLEGWPEDLAWDLQALPVTRTDARISLAVSGEEALSELQKLPIFSHLQVDGYLASPAEIEDAISNHFGGRSSPPERGQGRSSSGSRPRPPRVGFDQELFLESGVRRLTEGASLEVLSPCLPERPCPDPIPLELEEGASPVIDALFETPSVNEVLSLAGECLGVFFRRLLVARVSRQGLHVVGHRGFGIQDVQVSGDRFPVLFQTVHRTSLSYGGPRDDRRAWEVIRHFIPDPPTIAFVGTLGAEQGAPALLYGDNGAFPELFDDLHPVEILFKEVETALGMLNIAGSSLNTGLPVVAAFP